MIMNNPVSSFFHPSSFEVWMEFWMKVLSFLFVDVFFLSSLSLCDVMKERLINAIEIGESHERDNFHMN